MDQKRDD